MKRGAKGNPDLSALFIPFMALFAIVFGEIIPACEQNGGCFVQSTVPGTKQSFFVNYLYVSVVPMYLILGTVFWLLYRNLSWKIVAVIAVGAGELIEFLLFRPREPNGVNVIDHPVSAFFFLLLVWLVLLVLPYGVFVTAGRAWDWVTYAMKAPPNHADGSETKETRPEDVGNHP